ncbi:MAG TPA: MFS transporter [Rhizobiaceae bacterium]|nr:MFS transporter [Rhizobiaceae bacterium]
MTPAARPSANASLIVLSAANFCSAAVMRAADPMIPLLAAEFHVTVARSAVVATAFALAYGLFQFAIGPFSDRVGKVRLITGATLLVGLSTLAGVFAGSLESLAALRFVAGAAAGAIIPLGLAYVGDIVPPEQRQEVLSRYIGGQILGLTLGPAIAGILSEYFSWRFVFAFFGTLLIAVSALLLKEILVRGVSEPRAPVPRRLGQNYLALLSSARARLVLVSVLIEGFLIFGGITFVGAFVVHRYGMGYDTAGLIGAGFGAGGLIYVLSARWLLARLHPRRMVLAGGLLLLVCFTALSLQPPLAMVTLIVALMGLGFYLMHNILQNRATQMLPGATGLAMSVFAASLFVGQSLGISAFGALIAVFGYEPAFLTIGVCFGIGATLLSMLIGRQDIRSI